jgi:hypothetical protein
MHLVLARQIKVTSEIDDCGANPAPGPRPIASALPNLEHQVVTTPRTAQRYAAFKAVSKQPRKVVKLQQTRPTAAVESPSTGTSMFVKRDM